MNRHYLVTSKQMRAQHDVSGLVDAVHVAEGGGDREHGANLGERLVDAVNLKIIGADEQKRKIFRSYSLGLRRLRLRTHLLRSGVEVLLGCAGVVNAILLAAGDADLHLEPDSNLGHALEVLGTSRDVLAILLL